MVQHAGKAKPTPRHAGHTARHSIQFNTTTSKNQGKLEIYAHFLWQFA
jgi:hypothetical protein